MFPRNLGPPDIRVEYDLSGRTTLKPIRKQPRSRTAANTTAKHAETKSCQARAGFVVDL